MHIDGILTYLRRLRRKNRAFPRYILLDRVEYDILPPNILPWVHEERESWVSNN